VLAVVGPAPATYVRDFTPHRDAAAFAGIVHRWTREKDIVALLWVLRQMVTATGSIEAFFLRGDDGAPDVERALDSFSARAMALDLTKAYGRVPKRPGVCYFFPRPSAGSACKRLNLFLRWMVRRDALDLGVWTRVEPARLIVPLDTHVIRMGRYLKLTSYKSPGWRMARDITSSLRTLDPIDPVKYDFALCHLSMAHPTLSSLKAQLSALVPSEGARRPRRFPRPSARP
jgi:uncharacterized protein (TIGR02757 family)